MSFSSNLPILLEHLKKILKKKKIKYTDLSKSLDMSESSIKRLMSSKDMNLSKLESICEVVGITLFDLMEMSKEDEVLDYILNKKQMAFFEKNTHYLYFLILIHEDRLSVKQVQKKYKLTDKSVMKYLKKLEELGFLERHPGNKVKFLFSGGINIDTDGSLGRHLMNTSLENFKNIVTKKPGDPVARGEGMVSISEWYMREESAKEFRKEISAVLKRAYQVSAREEKVYGRDELKLYSTILSNLPMRLYSEDIPNLK